MVCELKITLKTSCLIPKWKSTEKGQTVARGVSSRLRRKNERRCCEKQPESASALNWGGVEGTCGDRFERKSGVGVCSVQGGEPFERQL